MKSIFYYLWYFYMYCCFRIRQMFRKPQIKINLKQALEKYSDKMKNKFFLTFENETVKKTINENIDSIFYNKEEFEKIILTNNKYEEKWKQNILFKSIPREDGKYINIIMFYDVYKSGFSYFCDENSVSYNVLNNAAMQYVLTFHCRDFFIDESLFLGKTYDLSPFTPKREILGKNIPKHVIHNSSKSKVFKDYINSKNKFIYLGKISNFIFLKNTNIKKKHQLQQSSSFNYKQFKNIFN